jgi:hypothetical protein
VDLNVEREGDLMAHNFEALKLEQVLDIAAAAREEIVADEHAFTKVRTQEPSAARNQYASSKARHTVIPFQARVYPPAGPLPETGAVIDCRG